MAYVIGERSIDQSRLSQETPFCNTSSSKKMSCFRPENLSTSSISTSHCIHVEQRI